MPMAARKPCTWFGCSALTDGGRCDLHRKQAEQQRGSARQRGYDSKWEKAREGFLHKHPVCRHCQEGTPSIFTPATVVDHIVPHRGDKDLFWLRSNWQPLCKPCHDRKTATEDGGGGWAGGVAKV